MLIPPINPAPSYQEALEPIKVKNIPQKNSSSKPSLFRAWTRNAVKTLASTSATIALPPQQSSKAFWAQWPGKKWRAS